MLMKMKLMIVHDSVQWIGWNHREKGGMDGEAQMDDQD